MNFPSRQIASSNGLKHPKELCALEEVEKNYDFRDSSKWEIKI